MVLTVLAIAAAITLVAIYMPASVTREDGPVELAQIGVLALTSLVALTGTLIHIIDRRKNRDTQKEPWSEHPDRFILTGLAAVTAALAFREVSSCGSDYMELFCLPQTVKYGAILVIMVIYFASGAFSRKGLGQAIRRILRQDKAWSFFYCTVALLLSLFFEELLFARGEELLEIGVYGTFLVLAVQFSRSLEGEG